MSREMIDLERSGRQLRAATSLDNLPIISIKSASFFAPALWTRLMPLRAANQLRDIMHHELLTLSTDCHQAIASDSSHFVWVDQPDMIVKAIQQMVGK